ncbi:MAG: GFA family protein [Bdellovibrionota bacterium]
MKDAKKYKSSCHCGSVELELNLPNGFEDIRRCSCSMCRRRGAIVASVLLENLKVVKGKDCLTLYQFNTMTAKHFFCSKCGVYTHHQRRSNPHQYAFNMGCIEGINPFELGEIPLKDGVNHPSDTKNDE